MFGWGAPAFSPQSFKKTFRCYSIRRSPKENVSDDLVYGGKIFLPVSALEHLASMNIVYPMLFELRNPSAGHSTKCGVLEFIAEEGRVYLPDWMMAQLEVNDGDYMEVKNVSVPVGRFVKIQPQSESFLEITNPKAVLETALRNFACLSVGDVVEIKYNSKVYKLKVLEAKPSDSISIIEADVEVDFAPPPGYVEPSFKKGQDTEVPMDEDLGEMEPAGFVPFSGGGQKLNGRPTATPAAGSPTRSPSPFTSASGSVGRASSPQGSVGRSPSPFGSVGRASPSPRQPSPFSFGSLPKNAAALDVPAGKLVFGKVATTSTPSSSSSSLTSSLNGSRSATPDVSASSSASKPMSTTQGFVPFSGSGRSLK